MRLRLSTAVGIAATLLAACGRAPQSAGLEPVGELAPFQLTDQDGKTFGNAEMAGRVWVTDFFFTSCPSVCPLLTAEMAALARDFAGESRLGFLSISVDPVRDTPQALRAHADKNGLPQERWRLLTGPQEEIRQVCENSFRLAFGSEFDASGDLLHSTRLALVDARGRVRGYFDALDPAQRVPVRAAIRAVLAEPAPQ